MKWSEHPWVVATCLLTALSLALVWADPQGQWDRYQEAVQEEISMEAEMLQQDWSGTTFEDMRERYQCYQEDLGSTRFHNHAHDKHAPHGAFSRRDWEHDLSRLNYHITRASFDWNGLLNQPLQDHYNEHLSDMLKTKELVVAYAQREHAHDRARVAKNPDLIGNMYHGAANPLLEKWYSRGKKSAIELEHLSVPSENISFIKTEKPHQAIAWSVFWRFMLLGIPLGLLTVFSRVVGYSGNRWHLMATGMATLLFFWSLFWFLSPFFSVERHKKMVEKTNGLPTFINMLLVFWFTLMAPGGAAYAQEAPPDSTASSADDNFLEVVDGKTAVRANLDTPVTLSLSNTFTRATARLNKTDGDDWADNADFRLTQLRLKVDYGDNWSGFGQVHLPGGDIRQLWVQHRTNLMDTKVSLKLGRQFVPWFSSVPPPFAGTLDFPLTDSTVTFFGDGLNVQVEALPGLTLSATAFSPISETRVPRYWAFGARYVFSDHAKLAVGGEIGPDPDEQWMAGAELVGDLWSGFTYNLFAVAQGLPDRSRKYGFHSFFRQRFLNDWAIIAQFDWLNHEQRSGSNRILRHFKATVGMWYEPTSFLRLQVDVSRDWRRGTRDQDEWILNAGFTLKFP